MIISDFEAISEIDRRRLASLLKGPNGLEDSAKSLWSEGAADNPLGFRIIKHEGSLKNGRRIRYEVMENNLFARGQFGKYYRCPYTLFFKDGKLEVKKREQGKIRLVKEQTINNERKHPIEQILAEASAMERTPFFHSKPIVCIGKTTFIIMRELPGEDLIEIILRNDLTIQERYDLTLAILKALAFIHDKGYVHRDISPNNILVSRTPNGNFTVFIIDYGFIKNQSYDDTNEHKGDWRYAAPEVYLNVIKTVKSDIYSMGRVLMYLWGDALVSKHRDKRTAISYEMAALDPGFKEVFSRMYEIPECYEDILLIFKNMCDPIPVFRKDISTIIEDFDQLKDSLNPYESPQASPIHPYTPEEDEDNTAMSIFPGFDKAS